MSPCNGCDQSMPTLPMFVLGHLVVPNSGSGHEAAVVPNSGPGHEAANHWLKYHFAMMVVLEERAVELPWRSEAAPRLGSRMPDND